MGVAKEKARARADCGSMYKYLLSAFLNVQVTIIPFAIDTFKSSKEIDGVPDVWMCPISACQKEQRAHLNYSKSLSVPTQTPSILSVNHLI